MARRGRTSARRAASNANRTPTPQVNEQSDEEMQDVPPSDAATPQEDDGEDQDEDGILEDGDEDEPSTPANESRTPSRNATPGRTRGLVPQKRRAGRPPKNPRPHDWEAPDDGELGTSDVGTPRKRGGWRGRGFGGGRWGKPRGGPSHATQVPLDKEGNMANVVDDEVELPDDPEGEQKVDKDGHLKGGREYRVRVFTIQGRGNRLYMLSTEPARCIGFRDSYLFFQKHPQLYKIILPEDAKRDLIDRNLIPHSYKGRAIGVVTARSVFREFGAKIIIGGKKIIDDYQVTAARANGDIEGELAVPEDRVPASGQAYDKNRYVAWHGASSVYHANNPSVPMPNGKIMDGKKRKVHVTGANWMFEHAQEASRFNSSLTAARRANLDGVYDPHTNLMLYPKIMQPTHARWEQLPTSPHLNGAHPNTKSSTAIVDLTLHREPSPPAKSIFTPIPPVIARNFLTADTVFIRPPISNVGVPGPDGGTDDVGPPGLMDIPDDIIAELPQECRIAFKEAREQERRWKSSFGTERDDGNRADIKITYNGW